MDTSWFGAEAQSTRACSLLPVVRRDPEQIAEVFAKQFVLVEARRESHTTPGGSVQRFVYALLRKRVD